MGVLLKYYAKNNFLTSIFQKNLSLISNLSNNDLLELYNYRFLKIFKRSYQTSSFYNSLYKTNGINIEDIKDFTDLKKLPVINRNDIKNKAEEIYNGVNYFKIKGFTSGTSGSPLTVFRTLNSINSESAYLRHFRSIHGFQSGQPIVSIRGVLDKNTLYRFDKISNTLYLSSSNINPDNIDMFHSLMKRLKPKAIEAFPSYYYKLYLELSKKKLHIDIPVSFTSSEMLYEFQREQLEAYFKTKIFDWYGNVERSIGLVQYNYKEYKPLPLYSINEFEKDKIITTSLNNKHFPLIRYAVDDVIDVKSDDFINNIVSPEIIKINGRAGDSIELKDGGKVSCIDHAFKGINHLTMAQIHQQDVLNPLIIKLVVENEFSNEDENHLKFNLRKMIGKNMQMIFQYCNKDDLHYFNGDKFKLIVKSFEKK